MLSDATWLKNHGKGGPEKITVFTPAPMIAEDAGKEVVRQLLDFQPFQDIERSLA